MTATATQLSASDYETYLTPEELAEYDRLQEADFGGEGLADFIRRVAPHEPPPPHLDPIIAVLERAKLIGHQRVCLSIPPRHAKSTTIRRALAWWMQQRPADCSAYVSRTCDGAEAQSRKVRMLANQIRIPLRRGSQRDDRWETDFGGGLIACGIDGMLTGNPITGLGIIDDPIKSRAEANSEAYRERVWDFFNDVLMTRLEGPASVFVIHTRWDIDDLIGRLLVEGGWDVINLPALAEERDPLGRRPGDPLWPERFDRNRLLKIQKRNQFTFDSLYQGKPTPKGARMFYGPPRYYDPKDPAFIKAGGLKGCHVLIGADPAATEKTTADHSAAVAMAVRDPLSETPIVYILDVYRDQVETPRLARDLLKFQARNYGAKLWVEAVAGFKAVPQLLRDLAKGVLVGEINPKGDKRQRAERFASAWNDGRVLLPKSDPHLPGSTVSPPWAAEFISELQKFTGKPGGQDDQVDACANAFNQLGDMGGESKRGAVADPDRWR